MKTFNSYAFYRDLLDELESKAAELYSSSDYSSNECAEDMAEDHLDELSEFVSEHLDNAVIYYADCFAICAELGATHFIGYEALGGEPAKDICQLAFAALYDYVYEEKGIDFSEIFESVIPKAH